MNGFEPLRRRIIDYTEAGQWSEVYDGPLEDCESEKLKAENAKLRELVADMWHEGMCECGSRGKCASCEYDYPTRMRELGVEMSE